MYYFARVFLPLLIASGDGVLVNTNGMNGFWATYGPGKPGSAISTADFAVKGFTEAFIEDLRVAAPQVRVAVVMPGWVGTDMVASSLRVTYGLPPLDQMTDAQVTELFRKGEDAVRRAFRCLGSLRQLSGARRRRALARSRSKAAGVKSDGSSMPSQSSNSACSSWAGSMIASFKSA